jgi:hypothetical protein
MTLLPLVVSDAGIAGLIVAALAARQGRPVIVIGTAAALQLPLQDDARHFAADLQPQIWPADSLERLIRRLDLRLTIQQPELPLQVLLSDGRRFDDWQDPHRRAVSRSNWCDTAAGERLWQRADQLTLQLQRAVGGSGGIVNAIAIAQQRGRRFSTVMQQAHLTAAAQRQCRALAAALDDEGPADGLLWLRAASALTAGAGRRAAIVGGTPALAAALQDAILRDGGRLLPRRRIRTVSSGRDALMLELRDGTQLAADRLVIDGGRPGRPTAVLAALSRQPFTAAAPVLQIRQQPDGSSRTVAVTTLADPQLRIVSVEQPIAPALLRSLRAADATTRRAARQALLRQLSETLLPFAAQSARLAVVPAGAQPHLPAAQPRISRIERCPDLIGRYAADFIEGIGAAQRLGYC